MEDAPAPAISLAVGEFLGPPSKYHYRERKELDADDILRQIELAESSLRFGKSTGSRAMDRYSYIRVLRRMPNDVTLHYKVWQLLYATHRWQEAEESYRATCEHMPCDITVGSYHACLTTSARIKPSVPLLCAATPINHRRRPRATTRQEQSHMIEMPQPNLPDSLAAHVASSPQRPFFAFNPAIAPYPEMGFFGWTGSRTDRSVSDVVRYVVFFRYSNVRSIWTSTTAHSWQRAVDWPDWRQALSHGHVLDLEPHQESPSPPSVTERKIGAKGGTVARAWPAGLSWSEVAGTDGRSSRAPPRGAHLEEALGSFDTMLDPEGDESERRAVRWPAAMGSGDMGDAARASHDEMAAVLEQAESKARGEGTAERWRLLMAQVGEEKAEEEDEEGGLELPPPTTREPPPSRSSPSSPPLTPSSSSKASAPSWQSSTSEAADVANAASSATASHSRGIDGGRGGRGGCGGSGGSGGDEDDLQIFDFDEDSDGVPFLLPSAEQYINDQAFALGASNVGDTRGGYSAIGYFVVERHLATGEVTIGDSHWLELAAPFAACECLEYELYDLSPALCLLAIGAPRLSSFLVACCFAVGVAQLVSGVRRTRAHGRLARAKLLRGLLLIGAAMPISNCRERHQHGERCLPVEADDGQANHSSIGGGGGSSRRGSGGLAPVLVNGSTRYSIGSSMLTMNMGAPTNANASAGLLLDGQPWNRTDVRRKSSHLTPRPQHVIEYDGYEDARAITHRGTLYLLANHEDCDGRRRLCLLRLAGDAGSGSLRQDATWVLRVDDGPDGPFELQDNEKNWVPFVEGGALHLSYSLQPHVVLRCAWTGGSCHQIYNSTSDFLRTYDTQQQGLRGGTPYVRLPNGDLLGAMHVKDYAHAPALYATLFYIAAGRAPFQIISLSPKLCLSERALELPTSPRCALQYVVGLAIEPDAARPDGGSLLVSFGQMDRQMRLAALPLDPLVALTRTHQIAPDGGTSTSECESWG